MDAQVRHSEISIPSSVTTGMWSDSALQVHSWLFWRDLLRANLEVPAEIIGMWESWQNLIGDPVIDNARMDIW
jgi:hypothetical protein